MNRVSIYSKYEAVTEFKVADVFTSLSLQFQTEVGVLNIYSTIIGTRFNKLPYAKIELDNCVNDCLTIFAENKSLCLVGDLNTAFLPEDFDFQINKDTTSVLIKLATDCNMDMTTADLKENIDHIFVPKGIAENFNIEAKVFIEKGILSDHKGVSIEITHFS